MPVDFSWRMSGTLPKFLAQSLIRQENEIREATEYKEKALAKPYIRRLEIGSSMAVQRYICCLVQ
jgi:hypothetical protein